MIALDDRRWDGLKGGYKMPYDPRPILRTLEAEIDDEEAWATLWEELHHQGDVGEASYAVVPYLIWIQEQSPRVSLNVYALVSTIEIERHRIGNPPIPAWMCESYRQAWARIVEVGCRDLSRTNDPLCVQSILGALALAKAQLKLGTFIAHSDSSEIDELLEERCAWSKLYSESGRRKDLPPAPHTTGHGGPRPAVPGSPEG